MIFANWKLNPKTKERALEMAEYSDSVGVVICPPFPYIETVRGVLKNAEIGAQNCYLKNNGAYTGEVSADILKSVGCKYVILGHSERRGFFNETSKFVNEKIKHALEQNLIPVVCIGEKEKDNAIGQIKLQIKETFNDVPLENIIIAYEPVFAIGTGENCPIDLARERKNFISDLLLEGNQSKSSLKIIYGGSVNSSNAFLYLKEAGFDGVLVGTTSLDGDDFPKLSKSIIEK